MIIGSGGAGKSTLARQLGERLGLPVYHLDALLWKPGWVMTPKDEERTIFQKLVRQDRWIIDGNYGSGENLETRLAVADTVILLDLPRLICLWSAVKRYFQWRGRTRPDMGPECPEQLDWEYVRWIWNYPRNSLPRTLDRMAAHQDHQRQVRLRSRREIAAFLSGVR
jgi:adenylate kinase family enzyme